MNFFGNLLRFVFRRFILLTLVLGLVVSNILSLLNADFHDKLYEAVADVVPTTWSRNSPANRKSSQAIKNEKGQDLD